MTPTADLMKLVDEMRQWAVDGCYNDADDGEAPFLMVHQTQQSYLAIADRIEAALSATGEARVGGEAFVSIPRDIVAALPILHALSDAAGFDRLPDPGNEDGFYPITGQQSTVRQWYDAIIAAALTTPAQPKASCTCPSGDGSLRWPCPQHPPEQPKASEGKAGGEVDNG